MIVTKSHIEEILKQNGLKITKTRFSTLKALYELNHPSVEDIVQYLFLADIKTTVQSVYNNLELYEELNIIKKIATNGSSMRYDIHSHNHCHIHMNDSNEVNDYHDQELMDLIENHFKNKKITDLNIKSIDVIITAKEAPTNNISNNLI